MSSERIPCPVEGCDEEFDDEAAAAAHMKEKHRELYSAPGVHDNPGEAALQSPAELPAVPGMEMVTPEILALIDARMDSRIEKAIPDIVNALKEAIVGAQTPVAAVPPGAGVIPGSNITPAGAQLINWMTRGGGGGSTDMENLAKTLTQARAISDVLNPPSIWDRVMQNAVLRSLSKAGLVTEAEMKEIIDETKKPS